MDTKNMLFEVDKIRGKIMECLDKALKAGMRGRVEVFEGYNFGSLLRMLRYSLFMSCEEFAKVLCKVNYSTISEWEMGRRKPYGKMVGKIVSGINILCKHKHGTGSI